MTAFNHIEDQARVLGVRLRLRLVDLAAIQQWAGHAILEDGGAHPDLTDLCMATSSSRTALPPRTRRHAAAWSSPAARCRYW